MKKISIEFNINDEAVKNVGKSAKNFIKSIGGMIKGHSVDVKSTEEKKETPKTKK